MVFSCREKATVINMLYSMPWTRFIPGFGKQMEQMKEGMDIGYGEFKLNNLYLI